MEPNTPQPGRIPPIQTGIKAPPVVPGASSITMTTENPKEALAAKATAVITKHMASRDSQNRYIKAKRKVQKRGSVPDKPNYRIKYAGTGGILLILAVIADIVGIVGTALIELFGIPEIVVEIINIMYGIILIGTMVLKGFEFASHSTRYYSVIAGLVGEVIPILNAAPFWTIDTWYVIHSIRNEDRETHRQLLQEIKNEKQEGQRQIFMENYAKQQEQMETEEGNEVENKPQVVV